MTIAFGSLSSAPQAGITSVMYRAPDTLADGDLILWCVTNKYPTNGPNAPTGLSTLIQASGGTGTPGPDAGDVYGTVFYKVSDGTEDAETQTVSIPSGNTATSRSVSFTRSAGTGWEITSSYGAQNTAAAAWSVSSAAAMDLKAGDKLVIVISQNSDADYAHNTYALSATGLGFSGLTARHGPSGSVGTTNGDDCGMRVLEADVTSGSGTETLNFSFNLTGSAANTAGVVLFIRLREEGAGDTPVEFTGTVPTLTGSQGTAFTANLSSYFAGSLSPFTYAKVVGIWPDGLSLDADTCVISGTPTVGGLFGPFVVQATDVESNTADTNGFYIALSSNPSSDLGAHVVDTSGNAHLEHTTVSHSFFHDGSWWTMARPTGGWNLYEESGNVPTPGNTVDWSSSAHLSAVHTSTQNSVVLDAARNKAYVIGFGGTAATVAFRVLTYASGSWTVTQSFNLVNSAGVGLGTSTTFANCDKLSIGVDNAGVPYVVSGNKGYSGAAINGVHFAWPDSAASLGGTWSSANLDATVGSMSEDISARFAGVVSQGGTDYIVVVYSHKVDEEIKMAYHAVETTLSNYSSGWTTQVISNAISVDNHVWGMVMNYDGEQVVVTLTKAGDGVGYGSLYCFTSQLEDSMAWTHKRHRITNGVSEAGARQEAPSRPVGILDQVNGDVYVVYHSVDSHPYGFVGYKKATLAALLAAGSETAVFDISVARNCTPIINDESLNAAWNAKTPAHPISTGMTYAPVLSAIAATNSTGSSTWWAAIEIVGPAIIDLTVDDVGHAFSSTSLDLVLQTTLAVNDMSHGNSVSSPTLVLTSVLVVANAAHAHSSTSPVLSVDSYLVVENSAHAMFSENLTIGSAPNLAIASSMHANTVSGVVLSVQDFLTIQNAVHAFGSSNLVLEATDAIYFQIASSIHAHTSDNLDLTVDAWLVVDSSFHAHSSDNLTLVVFVPSGVVMRRFIRLQSPMARVIGMESFIDLESE